MYITITEDNEVYEYALEFQTVFDKEIAVRIFRYSFERAVKLADYYMYLLYPLQIFKLRKRMHEVDINILKRRPV